jgi:hypothetical protein
MLNKRVLVVLSLVFVMALSACNLPTKSSADVGETENEPSDSTVEDDVKPIEENIANEAEPENVDETQGEYLACPVEGETLTLAFDHALTTEMPDVNLTHILQHKMLLLNATGENEDSVMEISSGQPIEMTYEMMGTMSECSVAMEGSMLASAYGTCVDGVVYLNIIESWQPANGEMICDDDLIPFQAPGAEYEHTGENGMGEVFYLTSEVNGYSSMRPFLAGSGYHTWTLYSQGIEVVPLSP